MIGCGGMGINIAKKFVGKKEEGFAEYDVFFCDTSKSNLTGTLDESKTYLFEGLDGSGKLRKSNYDVISERAKPVLQKVKPSDVTILVTSCSGGSGNVIAGILANEILKKEGIVVLACVGSTDSKIETENTIKTLKTFDSISSKNEKPLLAMYIENDQERGRGAVDHIIESNVILMSMFFSGANRELDSSDLKNFIRYDKVTSYGSRLTLLDFFSGPIELGRDQSLVSLVTLTDDNTSSASNVPVEYQAVGFMADNVKTKAQVKLPIHMAAIGNHFHNVVDRLEAKLKEINEARSAVLERQISSKDQATTSDGFVF